jgi:hypothetical protein
MGVVDSSFGNPLKLEEGASAPLAGGMLQYGYQCGMLWGAALAAGAQAYHQFGTGTKAETAALITAQRLVQAFGARNKHIECSELTQMNWHVSAKGDLPGQVLKFFLKGGPLVCFSMTANFARVTFDEIKTTLSAESFEIPASPVSCAALLVKKTGATDLHAVMAAGFAGGIGLSGSACGALGAAIWLLGMESSKKSGKKPGLENPAAQALVERYLECTDYEFECQKVVGRKFEHVADHAEYLHQGGCEELMIAMADRARV